MHASPYSRAATSCPAVHVHQSQVHRKLGMRVSTGINEFTHTERNHQLITVSLNMRFTSIAIPSSYAFWKILKNPEESWNIILIFLKTPGVVLIFKTDSWKAPGNSYILQFENWQESKSDQRSIWKKHVLLETFENSLGNSTVDVEILTANE